MIKRNTKTQLDTRVKNIALYYLRSLSETVNVSEMDKEHNFLGNFFVLVGIGASYIFAGFIRSMFSVVLDLAYTVNVLLLQIPEKL